MIKYIKLALLLSGLAYQANAAELQSTRFFQNNGGLMTHLSTARIPDNAATAIENITMDDRGQLSKRNGYTVIASTTSMIGFSTWTVNGGGYHTSTSGSSFFAVVVGTAVYRTSNSYGAWTSITGAVTPTGTSSNQAQTTNLQDELIFCNEVDKPFYVGASGNALTISTNTFDTAKTCSTYGSYLVVGNTTEASVGFTSRVRWSDINNINSFPALNFIDVEPNDGDKIVSLISYNESIYIFKHRSIYVMQITGLDGPDAFIIRPVARNIGAWAKNSVRIIPNEGIAFLAQNTVYLLNDSGLTPIGDPIQRTFDLVTRSMWTQAVAEVYPHRYQYVIAVSTAGTTNSTVLVYDYIQHNWTIFDDMNVNMLAQGEDAGGNNILLSRDYQATVYKQDNGSVDSPHGTSMPIVGSYTTGNLMMGGISSNTNYYIGLPDVTKGFKYLYLYTVGDQNYTLNVKASYDFSTTQEFNQSVQIGSSGAVYDTGIYDTDLYPGSGYTITRLELNRSARTIQLQFSNSTSGQIFGLVGWTVVWAPEDYKQ